jgi:GTP-binding protein
MKVQFLLSTFDQFPKLKDPKGNFLPEIALAGRSNVGKSSLINNFLNTKAAKVSATPGKTQLINFFLINEKYLLVDLPGYGFASAPLEAIQKWSESIDHYLNNRPTLKAVLLLIDSRRGPNEDDLFLLDWGRQKQIPIVVIYTKTDKLSRSELDAQVKKAKEILGMEPLLHSTKDKHSRYFLEKRIEQLLWA